MTRKVGFFALYGRVLGLLASVRGLALWIALANVLVAALQFAEPVLFGRVIDRLSTTVGSGGGLGATLGTLGLWGVLGVASIILSMVVAWQSDKLAHQQRLRALARFFEHVLTLPPAFHDATHSARVLKVMLTGTDNLFAIWLGFFREHLASFVSLIVLLPLTLFMNWRLSLLLIALIFIFAAITWFVVVRTHKMQATVESYHSALATQAGDALGNIVLIQSYVRLQAEVRAMENLTRKVLEAQAPVLGWWAILTVLTRTAATLATISMFALGAWLTTRGLATIGEIVTFMGFAGLLISRLEQALNFVRLLFFQRPALEEYFAVLDTVSSVVEKPQAIALERAQGEVAFDNVTFGYTSDKPAVYDLSFTIAPGQRVAVVGHSGSGKSTALALLLRLYDPDAGRVLIDGHDLRDVTLDSLRRNVGVVFQHSTLFQRSIGENLRVGRADATDEEVAKACEMAQARSFIEALPQGYDTMLGERGARLSGGERQRIAIARAILKDPPILLMDEATSALDTQTEVKLQQALATVMQGRTTFIIAHRLSTIRDVDRVLVMDRGRVVEQGSYDELMGLGGIFAGLVRAQVFAPDKSAAGDA